MSNSETSLPVVTNAATPAITLAQRVVKIQFHLQNMANSAIIIGQELIECKKEVGHGNWANWLKDNFNLTQQSANRFMRVAERFGKLNTGVQFDSTQMVEMLALPEGEEEKFIEEKAAEGKPVEEMSKRQLNTEIKKYKAEAEKAKKDAQKLKQDNENLRLRQIEIETEAKKQIEQLKNQPPQVIQTTKNIIPPDYVATVQRANELQEQVDQLLRQNEESLKTIEDLQNQVMDAVSKQGETQIEYVSEVPADYQELKDKLYDAQKEAENARAIVATERYIEQLFNSAVALNNSLYYLQALKNYMKKHPDTKDKIGMLRCLCDQLNAACDDDK